MPITFSIDPHERVVRADIVGTLEAADMVGGVRDIAALLAERPGYAVITDQRQVERPATRAQIDAVLDALSSLAPVFRGRRWAIVTAMPASYGMMRALGVYAERIPIAVAVFHDLDAARAWLAADAPGVTNGAPPG